MYQNSTSEAIRKGIQKNEVYKKYSLTNNAYKHPTQTNDVNSQNNIPRRESRDSYTNNNILHTKVKPENINNQGDKCDQISPIKKRTTDASFDNNEHFFSTQRNHYNLTSGSEGNLMYDMQCLNTSYNNNELADSRVHRQSNKGTPSRYQTVVTQENQNSHRRQMPVTYNSNNIHSTSSYADINNYDSRRHKVIEAGDINIDSRGVSLRSSKNSNQPIQVYSENVHVIHNPVQQIHANPNVITRRIIRNSVQPHQFNNNQLAGNSTIRRSVSKNNEVRRTESNQFNTMPTKESMIYHNINDDMPVNDVRGSIISQNWHNYIDQNKQSKQNLNNEVMPQGSESYRISHNYDTNNNYQSNMNSQGFNNNGFNSNQFYTCDTAPTQDQGVIQNDSIVSSPAKITDNRQERTSNVLKKQLQLRTRVPSVVRQDTHESSTTFMIEQKFTALNSNRSRERISKDRFATAKPGMNRIQDNYPTKLGTQEEDSINSFNSFDIKKYAVMTEPNEAPILSPPPRRFKEEMDKDDIIKLQEVQSPGTIAEEFSLLREVENSWRNSTDFLSKYYNMGKQSVLELTDKLDPAKPKPAPKKEEKPKEVEIPKKFTEQVLDKSKNEKIKVNSKKQLEKPKSEKKIETEKQKPSSKKETGAPKVEEKSRTEQKNSVRSSSQKDPRRSVDKGVSFQQSALRENSLTRFPPNVNEISVQMAIKSLMVNTANKQNTEGKSYDQIHESSVNRKRSRSRYETEALSNVKRHRPPTKYDEPKKRLKKNKNMMEELAWENEKLNFATDRKSSVDNVKLDYKKYTEPTKPGMVPNPRLRKKHGHTSIFHEEEDIEDTYQNYNSRVLEKSYTCDVTKTENTFMSPTKNFISGVKPGKLIDSAIKIENSAEPFSNAKTAAETIINSNEKQMNLKTEENLDVTAPNDRMKSILYPSITEKGTDRIKLAFNNGRDYQKKLALLQILDENEIDASTRAIQNMTFNFKNPKEKNAFELGMQYEKNLINVDLPKTVPFFNEKSENRCQLNMARHSNRRGTLVGTALDTKLNPSQGRAPKQSKSNINDLPQELPTFRKQTSSSGTLEDKKQRDSKTSDQSGQSRKNSNGPIQENLGSNKKMNQNPLEKKFGQKSTDIILLNDSKKSLGMPIPEQVESRKLLSLRQNTSNKNNLDNNQSNPNFTNIGHYIQITFRNEDVASLGRLPIEKLRRILTEMYAIMNLNAPSEPDLIDMKRQAGIAPKDTHFTSKQLMHIGLIAWDYKCKFNSETASIHNAQKVKKDIQNLTSGNVPPGMERPTIFENIKNSSATSIKKGMKNSEVVEFPNEAMNQLRASQRRSYRAEEPMNQVRQSQRSTNYVEEIFRKYDTAKIGRVQRNLFSPILSDLYRHFNQGVPDSNQLSLIVRKANMNLLAEFIDLSMVKRVAKIVEDMVNGGNNQNNVEAINYDQLRQSDKFMKLNDLDERLNISVRMSTNGEDRNEPFEVDSRLKRSGQNLQIIQKSVEDIFQRFDPNNTGRVLFQEFTQAIRALNQLWHMPAMSEGEISRIKKKLNFNYQGFKKFSIKNFDDTAKIVLLQMPPDLLNNLFNNSRAYYYLHGVIYEKPDMNSFDPEHQRRTAGVAIANQVDQKRQFYEGDSQFANSVDNNSFMRAIPEENSCGSYGRTMQSQQNQISAISSIHPVINQQPPNPLGRENSLSREPRRVSGIETDKKSEMRPPSSGSPYKKMQQLGDFFAAPFKDVRNSFR